MARALSQRVCIMPGPVKLVISTTGGAHQVKAIRTKKALCGKPQYFGHTVLVLVRGKVYAAPVKRLREYKQMWSFRP